MLFRKKKTYKKTYQSSILIQAAPFLRNFNHKTCLSYIYICNKSQTFRKKLKVKIDAVKSYSFRKPILGVYFIIGEKFLETFLELKRVLENFAFEKLDISMLYAIESSGEVQYNLVNSYS